MKKNLFLIIMIFTVSILFGMVEYQETSDGVRVTFVNDSTDLKQNDIEPYFLHEKLIIPNQLLGADLHQTEQN